MIKTFFKVVYRNLRNNKGFSAINITGLAIGMAAAILILLWIQDEKSYDNFHVNKDRIYEIWNRVPNDGKIATWNSVSDPTGPALEKDVPEIERAVRVLNNFNELLTVGERKIYKSGFTVDTGFLQIFTFPMIKGDAATALNSPNSLIVTETTARNLFGNEDALGKIVKLEDNKSFTVTGVVKDPPSNTRFKFDFLKSRLSFKFRDGQDYGWNDNSTFTYVLLKPNTSAETLDAKIKTLKQRYSNDAKESKWELFAYPLTRWRLYSSFTNGVEDGRGLSRFVNIFSIIAVLVLLIACINFMNLSTARSEKRAKEVGIRKAIGAQKSSLIGQFIGESVCLAFLAGVVAILIVLICLPAYNRLTEKELSVNFLDGYTWIIFIGFIILTGLLAGSYPAFFLSSFQPVKVLKGTFKQNNALITPRKALVVIQFTCAIVFIICTIIVKQQLDYAESRDTGYDKENIVYHFLTGDIPKNYELIKNELLETSTATSVTRTNSPLTERWSNGWGQGWDGKDPNDKTEFDRYLADEGLGTTAGLKFVEGRDFDLKKYPTDSTGLIINESSLKVMKFKDPIGKVVSDLGIDWHIVGVVKDFILTNPYKSTRPILICGAKSSFLTFQVVHIKLSRSTNTTANMNKVAAIFQKYNPDYPFEGKFIDDAYAQKFDSERRQGVLAALFAGLTIFISCLGLFGLATYMAENRIKEIGVRKVLGASVTSITTLLSKDFVKLVLISFLIAAPLSYWSMYKWLQDFEYRVGIHWWVFALACILAVVIAVLTVSYQAIKAALMNPVTSLKKD